MAKAPETVGKPLQDLPANTEMSLTELEADAVRGGDGDEKKKKVVVSHPVVISIIGVLVG